MEAFVRSLSERTVSVITGVAAMLRLALGALVGYTVSRPLWWTLVACGLLALVGVAAWRIVKFRAEPEPAPVKVTVDRDPPQ